MGQVTRLAAELIRIAKDIIVADKQAEMKFEKGKLRGLKYVTYRKEGNLWRIIACSDFNGVKTGDLGGLIQSEKNLSQDGYSWVYDDAKVYGNASVRGFAQVRGKSEVYENAIIDGDAVLTIRAKVYGNAVVNDESKVTDNAKVHGFARVSGGSIAGNAEIDGYAEIGEKASVYGNVVVNGDDIVIRNGAKVHGDFTIDGEHEITSDVTTAEQANAFAPMTASVAKVASMLIETARMLIRQ